MKTELKIHRPLTLYLLSALHFLLGIGGLYGGFMFLSDPTGANFGMDTSPLAGSPFSDYLLPGLLLFFVMGILPLFLSIALLRRRDWLLGEFLNLFPDRRWEWAWSLYLSIGLIIWMDVQLILIGYGRPIQAIYVFFGLLLLVTTLWPAVQRYLGRPMGG